MLPILQHLPHFRLSPPFSPPAYVNAPPPFFLRSLLPSLPKPGSAPLGGPSRGPHASSGVRAKAQAQTHGATMARLPPVQNLFPLPRGPVGTNRAPIDVH